MTGQGAGAIDVHRHGVDVAGQDGRQGLALGATRFDQAVKQAAQVGAQRGFLVGRQFGAVIAGFDHALQRQQAGGFRRHRRASFDQGAGGVEIDREDIVIDADTGRRGAGSQGKRHIDLATHQARLGQVPAQALDGFEAGGIAVFDVEPAAIDAARFEYPRAVGEAAFGPGETGHRQQGHDILKACGEAAGPAAW